jgi:hypothetical protein
VLFTKLIRVPPMLPVRRSHHHLAISAVQLAATPSPCRPASQLPNHRAAPGRPRWQPASPPPHVLVRTHHTRICHTAISSGIPGPYHPAAPAHSLSYRYAMLSSHQPEYSELVPVTSWQTGEGYG